MNKKDKYIRQKLLENDREIPVSAKNRIEETLFELPEQEIRIKTHPIFKKFTTAFVCFLLVTIVLLPNVSVTYAETLEKIPVLGDIIRVITIRNYFYSDDYHEMNVSIPKLEGNNEEIDFINADVKELSEYLVQRFYHEVEELGNEAHSSVYVDYKVVTDTKDWFTLKLVINEVAGSGNIYFKYYHLNKLTGKIMTLENIVADNEFYDVVEKEIKLQMEKQMSDNSNLKYWVDDSTFGDDFVTIKPNHNFYWDQDYNLVIPFDKYEVAPGYMGTFEFVIDKGLIKEYINPEIKKILF